MDKAPNKKILTNVELKEKLDEVTRDLNEFDELTNIIEEQPEILALEQQLKDLDT